MYISVIMICTYILYSSNLNRFYIGSTQDDVQGRLAKHNEHTYGSHRYSAITTDWEIFLYIECTSFAQAVRIEKHIKKMKSAVYIRNLKTYPEMIDSLIQKNTSI
jgi:putative endonuclease